MVYAYQQDAWFQLKTLRGRTVKKFD